MGRLRYIRLTRRQRVRVWTAVVLITVTGLLTAILLHLRPMLVKLATARCSNTVSRIVVAAVNDAVEQGWMEYGRLVSFDKDSDGRVTALRSNMAEFNRLQTAVADDVLERLGQVSASALAVPLDVDVHGTILLPGITTYTKVSNEISVAETVIVGSVPQTYTYFSTTEDTIEDYADEYIMNNG